MAFPNFPNFLFSFFFVFGFPKIGNSFFYKFSTRSSRSMRFMDDEAGCSSGSGTTDDDDDESWNQLMVTDQGSSQFEQLVEDGPYVAGEDIETHRVEWFRNDDDKSMYCKMSGEECATLRATICGKKSIDFNESTVIDLDSPAMICLADEIGEISESLKEHDIMLADVAKALLEDDGAAAGAAEKEPTKAASTKAKGKPKKEARGAAKVDKPPPKAAKKKAVDLSATADGDESKGKEEAGQVKRKSSKSKKSKKEISSDDEDAAAESLELASEKPKDVPAATEKSAEKKPPAAKKATVSIAQLAPKRAPSKPRNRKRPAASVSASTKEKSAKTGPLSKFVVPAKSPVPSLPVETPVKEQGPQWTLTMTGHATDDVFKSFMEHFLTK